MAQEIDDAAVESMIRTICNKEKPAEAVEAKLEASRWLMQVDGGMAAMSPVARKKLETALAENS
jgi:hypothetical protein